MSDRALLEMAAKAAGYTLKWGDVFIIGDAEVDCTDMPYVASSQPDESDWHWSPLDDDGDALRLAVALGLKVMPYPIYGVEKHSVIVSRRVPATDPESLVAYDGPEVVELYGDDPYAATRLAIVRAAAEIGKAMT